jgi:Regulator of ribonuclease activity B
MKPRVIPKIGDIVEINTPKGLAYVQYTARHTVPPGFGDLVRVLPGLYKTRPSDFSVMAKKKENYFIFTPLGLACRRKQAVIVGNEPVPSWARGIPLMRMANRFDENGKGHDWYLWDGVRTWPATGKPEELNKVSIASIWGHDVLIDRLAEGWLPSDDPVENPSSRDERLNYLSDTKETTKALEGESEISEPRQVRHYLYFPTETSARDAAEVLKADGYSAHVRRSKAQDSWLLQLTAHTQLDENELSKTMTYLKSLAAAKGGEYDGWDALVSDAS